MRPRQSTHTVHCCKMSYSKDYPPEKSTYRNEQHTEAPPPTYDQGYSTNPFYRGPDGPPAAHAYPPASGYDREPPYTGAGSSGYYSSHGHTIPPQPSPSGSSSSRVGGFVQGLSGSSPETLLNPPPPSFSRAPQSQFPYTPFPTCVVTTIGKGLDSGFPMLPPPTQVQPHPFMTHDVNEEDWTRFLGDLKKAGTLSPMNRIVAGVAPMAMGVGFIGGES